ncbi:AP-4 complex subunit mu [Biomphalaria glabrata]|nr:AP-4 complex subunit mu-like [Biomphalaria glabrata]KAI8788536.1 AP-4 complex subunit mu [Biomphalaria glabrata]
MQEHNTDINQDSEWKRPDTLSHLKAHTLTRISEVMILDSQCGLLVLKRSLQNLPHRKAFEVFSKQMKLLGQKCLNPYFRCEGVDFFYLCKNDIYLVAAFVSPESDDAISVVLYLDLLQRLYDIMKDCIGTVNEAYVTVNRMLIFELLDEVVNSGYCFVSSYAEVKPHLTFEPIRPTIPQPDDLASRFFGITVGDGARLQAGSTELKSKAPNSAYINIVEELSAVFSPNGEVRSAELWGKLTLISTLDQPCPIFIQLNSDLVILTSKCNEGQVAGAVHIDNPSFHPSVDTSLLVKKKVLRVLPPPDQTRLMVYTLSDSACIHIPVVLIPSLMPIDDSRDYKFSLRLINQAESRARASYIRVKVKLPSWVTSVCTTKSGDNQSSHFDSQETSAEWEVKKSAGRTEAFITFRLINPKDKSINLSDIGPISIAFYMTQFSASGLVVNMAKMETQSPDPLSVPPNFFFGVSTKAASYIVRTDVPKD